MPFWCVGNPVMSAERDGEHDDTLVYMRSNTVPLAANASRLGVTDTLFPSVGKGRE